MGFFSNRKSEPTVQKTQFTLADQYYEFDSVYEFVVRFAAANEGKCRILIEAYTADTQQHKKGDICIHLTGDSSLGLLTRNYSQAVSNFIFGRSTGSGNYLMALYEFHEPDCYIFGCPQNQFAREVQEYAGNGKLTAYRQYTTYIYAQIEFDKVDYFEPWNAFKKYCDIWFR